MLTRGVLFYSLGRSCLVRLAVAMATMRRVWKGPATCLHYGEDGAEDAYQVSILNDVGFKRCDVRVPPGKNVALLGKTLLHLDTPYDVSVLLDADTVTMRAFPELFNAAEQCEFAMTAFSDWKSNGFHYRRRIKEWASIVPPDWIDAALALGPAINTGVFAFHRESTLQAALFDYAVKARGFFIPDEIGVCVLAPHYRHKVLPRDFNTSCRYDDPRGPNVRIVHFHGDKHARIRDGQFLNNADIWLREFEAVRKWPAVQKNIQHDRQLRNNLAAWDNIKGVVPDE